MSNPTSEVFQNTIVTEYNAERFRVYLDSAFSDSEDFASKAKGSD